MSGNINISGHMARKSVVKDTGGNIINLLDETNGGYIIRNRQIVNPERYAELQKLEEDRKIAAQAILHQVESPNAEMRNMPANQAQEKVGKLEELEKRLDGQDSKLDAILLALNKK